MVSFRDWRPSKPFLVDAIESERSHAPRSQCSNHADVGKKSNPLGWIRILAG